MASKVVSVRVAPEVAERLEALAEQSGTTVCALGGGMLAQAVSEREAPGVDELAVLLEVPREHLELLIGSGLRPVMTPAGAWHLAKAPIKGEKANI